MYSCECGQLSHNTSTQLIGRHFYEYWCIGLTLTYINKDILEMGPFDGTYTSLWNDDLKPDNVDIYTYLEIFFPV